MDMGPRLNEAFGIFAGAMTTLQKIGSPFKASSTLQGSTLQGSAADVHDGSHQSHNASAHEGEEKEEKPVRFDAQGCCCYPPCTALLWQYVFTRKGVVASHPVLHILW